MRELSLRAIVAGALLGVVFGASSLYLVLKVGLTVSASIPVAVISVTLFRLWAGVGGRDATILENNIVQTAGSAGESIAFGLGVTMPAILILGFDLEIRRVMLVGLLGSLLGILMMIPLRRALIVAQHGQLKYPEGTACAQVLKAGAAAGPSTGAPAINASTIFAGFGIGLGYKALMSALRLWKDIPEKVFGPPLRAGSIACEITPELLGVGYIIGPRIGSIMMAGGVLSCLVLVPLIAFFGEGLSGVLAPGSKPIRQMTPEDIRSEYVLYIGAGAVAAGGIISLVRSLPIILHSIRSGLRDLRPRSPNGRTSDGRGSTVEGARRCPPTLGNRPSRPDAPESESNAAGARAAVRRTERDLPMGLVAGGIGALLVAILAAPALHMNLLGASLIVLFGFLFVTVSSRVTGEIGSSSNPISGMTVATLLLTCLCFLLAGWTGAGYYVTALSVGGIVCVAASNAGATLQDLKTGFLVGATPRHQQVSILIGATASALLLGPILLLLNDTATVYVPAAQVAPGLRAAAGARLGPPEKLRGPQARSDAGAYRSWQKADTTGGPPGKYLVNQSGAARWLVDPGINGAFKTRPDGTEVRKFDAPKATLMSYIIKGMLDRKLPWGLVLFGVMIAVVLELSGVSSLAFAVGVYLPISSSAPIFVGGLVRWLVDSRMRRQFRLRNLNLNEAQLAAQSDQTPACCWPAATSPAAPWAASSSP